MHNNRWGNKRLEYNQNPVAQQNSSLSPSSSPLPLPPTGGSAHSWHSSELSSEDRQQQMWSSRRCKKDEASPITTGAEPPLPQPQQPNAVRADADRLCRHHLDRERAHAFRIAAVQSMASWQWLRLPHRGSMDKPQKWNDEWEHYSSAEPSLPFAEPLLCCAVHAPLHGFLLKVLMMTSQFVFFLAPGSSLSRVHKEERDEEIRGEGINLPGKKKLEVSEWRFTSVCRVDSPT